MITGLDHITVRTAQLDVMIAWYRDTLGLTHGPRPDFPFGGAWMYAGDDAVVHLVAVDAEPGADMSDLKLEHGAFRATGFAEMCAKFDAAAETYEVTPVPGYPIVQINVWDPDGNHLHVDFDAAECG